MHKCPLRKHLGHYDEAKCDLTKNWSTSSTTDLSIRLSFCLSVLRWNSGKDHMKLAYRVGEGGEWEFAVLWMQGVDKQSDSDRLCLHSLFSNRPTQSHQWGAHMHAHTRVRYRSCTLIYTHIDTVRLFHTRAQTAVTHSVLQLYKRT